MNDSDKSKERLLEDLNALRTRVAELERTNQGLQESELRLWQLVENIRGVFWMESADGSEVLYVSPTYEEIWGLTRQSLYEDPQTRLDAIHPEDRERVMEAFARLRKEGKYREEFRIVRSDGSTQWILDRGAVIRNEAGDIQHVIGIAEEITERKQAEKALERSERLYRNAIEVADAVPYYQNYKENIYEFVGEGIKDLTGYAPEEFTPEIWSSLELEMALIGDLEGLPIAAAVKKARGSEGISWRADYRIRKRDGMERWLANAAVQVRNEHG
ncbi:MAG: PAS domain-containing protein, partial [bacterium]